MTILPEADAPIMVIGDLAGPGAYHVGDEAMAEAVIELLGELIPAAPIVAVSADPAATASAYGCDAVPRIGFGACTTQEERDRLLTSPARSEALTAVGGARALVVAGGGNLSSSWPAHIYERVALARAARAAGRPVLVLGQTIGPVLDRSDAALVAELLCCATLVGVREATSEALALRLGVEPGRLLRQADEAIFLQSRRPLRLDIDAPYIAVTIHPFAPIGSPSLLALARQLGEVAAATGLRLVFVPHASAPEGTDGASDVDVASHLASSVGGTTSGIVAPREAIWLSQQAVVVVSTRYHPIVFATAVGVPALALPSDTYTAMKTLGALAHVGAARWALSVDRAVAGELVDAVSEIVRRSHDLRSWLARWRISLRAMDGARRHAIATALPAAVQLVDLGSTVPADIVTPVDGPQPAGRWARFRPDVADSLADQLAACGHATVLAEADAYVRARDQEVAEAKRYIASLREALASARAAAGESVSTSANAGDAE